MGKHRAQRSRGPILLLGSFVAIVAMLVGLFTWAGTQDEIAHASGESEAADGGDADSDALDDILAAALVPSVASVRPGITVRRITPVCSRVPVATRITVMSYNMKSAKRSSIGAIANVIRAADADVVLLQEVDRNRHHSGNIDQAAWLADRLGGWSHAFGQNVSHGGGSGYGTAIVSRWPIVAQDHWHLPNARGGQQRGLQRAVVDIKGVEVSFYSTHLQHRMEALRVRQARRIAGLVAGDANPRILGGDMNSWPNALPTRILKGQFNDTWDSAGTGAGPTNPARNPRGRIDYLMHHGSAITPVSASVLSAVASDHRAVRASYDLAGVKEKQCTTPTE